MFVYDSLCKLLKSNIDTHMLLIFQIKIPFPKANHFQYPCGMKIFQGDPVMRIEGFGTREADGFCAAILMET